MTNGASIQALAYRGLSWISRCARTLSAAALFGMIVLALPATSGPAFAQSWVGSVDEPPFYYATGSLKDPGSIEIYVLVDGKKQWLYGETAMAFLSARHYIEVNPSSGAWVITDKYRAWRKFAKTWDGTWKVRSKWLSKPGIGKDWNFVVKGGGGGSCQIHIPAKPSANITGCSISNDVLTWTEDQGGGDRVTFQFIRKGAALDGERSTFRGIIDGKQHHGVYTGEKLN